MRNYVVYLRVSSQSRGVLGWGWMLRRETSTISLPLLRLLTKWWGGSWRFIRVPTTNDPSWDNPSGEKENGVLVVAKLDRYPQGVLHRIADGRQGLGFQGCVPTNADKFQLHLCLLGRAGEGLHLPTHKIRTPISKGAWSASRHPQVEPGATGRGSEEEAEGRRTEGVSPHPSASETRTDVATHMRSPERERTNHSKGKSVPSISGLPNAQDAGSSDVKSPNPSDREKRHLVPQRINPIPNTGNEPLAPCRNPAPHHCSTIIRTSPPTGQRDL